MRPAGAILQVPQVPQAPQVLSLATALSHHRLPPFPLHHLPVGLERSLRIETPHPSLSLPPTPTPPLAVWL